MPRSYFSVVQYVPDPFADERVNVGLVVLSEDGTFAKAIFPDSRRRAQRLSPGVQLDVVDRLRDELAARLPAAGGQGRLRLAEPLTVEDLERMHAERGNILQVTEPRPSSADPEELATRLQAIYLRPIPRSRRARGARAVRSAIRSAFADVGVVEHLQPQVVIRGRHDEYEFAYGLVNGAVQHVIEAMSFERADRSQVREDLYATAYRFEDLRRADFREPLSLVVAATANDVLLDTAVAMVADVGGRLVPEGEVAGWAREAGQAIVAH